ncbi:hypothetical protein WL68_19305 [Burkholderia cepacia]|nr:hypothetical protein WL68_19305 [Burkholderia cepacia]
MLNGILSRTLTPAGGQLLATVDIDNVRCNSTLLDSFVTQTLQFLKLFPQATYVDKDIDGVPGRICVLIDFELRTVSMHYLRVRR